MLTHDSHLKEWTRLIAICCQAVQSLKAARLCRMQGLTLSDRCGAGQLVLLVLLDEVCPRSVVSSAQETEVWHQNLWKSDESGLDPV